MVKGLSRHLQGSYADLRLKWDQLHVSERIQQINLLAGSESDRFFSSLKIHDQGKILNSMSEAEATHRLALMPPDDIVDVLQSLIPEDKFRLKALFTEESRADVIGLLAYAEDQAGGLTTPQFIRMRPDMWIEEAIKYVRQQIADSQRTIYYIYVLDSEQRLLGLISFRVLLSAPIHKIASDIMVTPVVHVYDDTPQAENCRNFSTYKLPRNPRGEL